MEVKALKQLTIFTLVIALLASSVNFAFAQIDSATEINELNETIHEKRTSIGQINRRIGEFDKQIRQKQGQRATLSVELDLLGNRIAKTELEILETHEEIDLVNAEIFLLEKELIKLEEELDRDRVLITDVLQEIQVQDNALPLQIFFGTESFSELLDHIDQLQTVSGDLENAIEGAKISKASVSTKQDNRLSKREQMEALEKSLSKEKLVLESTIFAQEDLISETQNSEAEFQALLQELRQEQEFISREINVLQSEIEGKLNANDEIGDSSVLTWPVNPTVRGISAYYHDPTYPFRHLFEHSGIDLPAVTGTPVKSVAPGYVAWARRGRLYGNYVMIIHSNGVATLYAHLSRLDVVADEFVTRGKTIGAVGSTGLSTGPHLHFEVRKNGMPTNPLDYLISY